MDSELLKSSGQNSLRNGPAPFKPFGSHVALDFISKLNRIGICWNIRSAFHIYHNYISLANNLKIIITPKNMQEGE